MKAPKMAAKAQKIYSDFVAVQAPKEVESEIIISSFHFHRQLKSHFVFLGKPGLGNAGCDVKQPPGQQSGQSRIRPGSAAHPEHHGTRLVLAVPAVGPVSGTDPPRTLPARQDRFGQLRHLGRPLQSPTGNQTKITDGLELRKEGA